MEELLSENWEVELELINWRSTAGPAYVLASVGQVAATAPVGCHSSCWYSLMWGEVIGWGGKYCLSREGIVSWSSDVPVGVTLAVALSSQGRTFALSPRHCQR